MASKISFQCRAARTVLGWSPLDLAARAGVSTETASRFERGKRIMPASASAFQGAPEEAGVKYLDDENGVRLRPMREVFS